LIFSPAFFSAFCYTALGIAIRQIGSQYSILSPRWVSPPSPSTTTYSQLTQYLTIFLTADALSLTLQAVGGGIAASSPPGIIPTTGNKLMLSGILFQLISMIIFCIFALDYFIRFKLDKPYARQVRKVANGTNSLDRRASDEETVVGTPAGEKEAVLGGEWDEGFRRNWTIMFVAIFISSVAIIVRGVYRSAELSQGWGESIMLNEKLQIFLDGMMMVIAVGVFNVFHPMWLLPKKNSWKGYH
jgi:hypothetical protein